MTAPPGPCGLEWTKVRESSVLVQQSSPFSSYQWDSSITNSIIKQSKRQCPAYMLNVSQICYWAQRWIKAHRFQIAVRDAESITPVTVLWIWGAHTDSSPLIPAFREERQENWIHVGEPFSFRMDEISISRWKVSQSILWTMLSKSWAKQ